MIKIALIDTMPDLSHKCFSLSNIEINKKYILPEYHDKGHGTAVCNIINKNLKNVKIVVYPIFQGTEDEVNIELLIDALYDILLDGTYHIVNLSCGVIGTEKVDELREICSKIYNAGTIIVSAYSNNGLMTYPACFDSVVGVDTSFDVAHGNDFYYIENSPINIQGYARLVRVAWEKDGYTFLSGSSFITPYITVKVAEYIQKGKKGKEIKRALKDDAVKVIKANKHRQDRVPFKIKKAILFPFNKEMHAVIRFSERVEFDIIGCYDFRSSMNVGRRIGDIIDCADKKVSQLVVCDAEKIEENLQIDTIIMGHLDQIKKLIPYDKIKKIIKWAIDRSINIYAYNDVLKEFALWDECTPEYLENQYYHPQILNSFYPEEHFEKLWQINTPVVGIIGTKSKQGKYTLMLKLINSFKRTGYSAEFLSTEPNGWLLGAAGIYSYGYHSDISIDARQGISVINDILHNIDAQKPDIIFTASQSNILPYDNMYLPSISMFSESFLLGINPDAVILNVSLEDDLEYIDRTINFTEAVSQTRIIAVDIFPFKTNILTGELYVTIESNELDAKLQLLSKRYPKLLITSSVIYGCDEIYNAIVNFLAEE